MHRPTAAPFIRCAQCPMASRPPRQCVSLTLIEPLPGMPVPGVPAAVAPPRHAESLADLDVTRSDPSGRPYAYRHGTTTRNSGPVHKNRDPINTGDDPCNRAQRGLLVPPLTAAFSRGDIVLARNGPFVGKAEAS